MLPHFFLKRMEKVNAVCEHESMGKEEIVRSAVQNADPGELVGEKLIRRSSRGGDSGMERGT